MSAERLETAYRFVASKHMRQCIRQTKSLHGYILCAEIEAPLNVRSEFCSFFPVQSQLWQKVEHTNYNAAFEE